MTSKSSARLIVSDFFVLTFLHSHRLGNWWRTKSCGTAAALSWIKPKVSTKRLQLLTHSASFGTNCSFDPRLAFLMRHYSNNGIHFQTRTLPVFFMPFEGDFTNCYPETLFLRLVLRRFYFLYFLGSFLTAKMFLYCRQVISSWSCQALRDYTV